MPKVTYNCQNHPTLHPSSSLRGWMENYNLYKIINISIAIPSEIEYPLPLISELSANLSGAHIFSKLNV